MMSSISNYLNRLQRLRVDKAHDGPAPHKPILLLSVLALFKNGKIKENKIYITPELVALFKTFWSQLVRSNNECKFFLPFTHLVSDKLWHLQPKPGFENIVNLKSSLRSISSLNSAVEFAYLDQELVDLMLDENSNLILTEFLLETYFKETKGNFTPSNTVLNGLIENAERKILSSNSDDYRMEV